MRTAITVGITKSGKAEILSHPDVPLNEQLRAFNLIDPKAGKFSQVMLFPSQGKARIRRFSEKNSGGVDFNSAHSVEAQQDKKQSKKLPDLTPTTGKKSGVNFNAAHPVEKQQDKKAAGKLEDLNKKFRPTATESKKQTGVNFDSALPVEKQGSKKSASRRPARPRKSRSSAKSRSPKTAEKQARTEGQPDEAAKSESEGPTL